MPSSARSPWAELWSSEPLRIKFLIRSVYDLLPSPSNLHRWGLVDSPACQLCQRSGTLEHILSCCPKALGMGGIAGAMIRSSGLWRIRSLQRFRAVRVSSPPSIPSPLLELGRRLNSSHAPQVGSSPMQETGTFKWTWEGSSSSRITSRPLHSARHGDNIGVDQAGGHSGAYCPLGRQIGGGK